MNVEWNNLFLYICKSILTEASTVSISAGESLFITVGKSSPNKSKVLEVSRVYLKLQENGIIRSLELRNKEENPFCRTNIPELIVNLSKLLDKKPGLIRRNASDYECGFLVGDVNYGYRFQINNLDLLKKSIVEAEEHIGYIEHKGLKLYERSLQYKDYDPVPINPKTKAIKLLRLLIKQRNNYDPRIANQFIPYDEIGKNLGISSSASTRPLSKAIIDSPLKDLKEILEKCKLTKKEIDNFFDLSPGYGIRLRDYP